MSQVFHPVPVSYFRAKIASRTSKGNSSEDESNSEEASFCHSTSSTFEHPRPTSSGNLPSSSLLYVYSAVSGDVVGSINIDEVEHNSVKSLKAHFATQIRVTRFRQRWFSEEGELQDETQLCPTQRVQLLILPLRPPEDGLDQKLINASHENRIQDVEDILKWPLDPDVTDQYGCTGLHKAAEAGRVDCLKLLLEAGARPEKEDFNGITPLHLAARGGHLYMVRPLLVRPKVLRSVKTALHCAAEKGHLEVVKLFLAAGANIHEVDLASRQYRTALHWAAQKGHLKVARHLVESGADVHKTMMNGASALHLAAQRGSLEIVRLLLKAGADINHPMYPSAATALHMAADKGHLEVVRLLLEAGAQKKPVTRQGHSVLDCAARSGRLEVVRLLLEGNFNQRSHHVRLDSALHLAAMFGHPEVVELLLQAGANKDQVKDVQLSSPEVISLLESWGA